MLPRLETLSDVLHRLCNRFGVKPQNQAGQIRPLLSILCGTQKVVRILLLTSVENIHNWDLAHDEKRFDTLVRQSAD